MLHKGNSSTLVLNLCQCPFSHSSVTPSSVRNWRPYAAKYGEFFDILPLLTLFPIAYSHSLSLESRCHYSIISIFYAISNSSSNLSSPRPSKPSHAQYRCSFYPLMQALQIPAALSYLKESYSISRMTVENIHPRGRQQVNLNRWTTENGRQSSSGEPGQMDHKKHRLQPSLQLFMFKANNSN